MVSSAASGEGNDVTTDFMTAPVEDVVAEAHEIVAEAIETYNPTHVFGLFSGGHDSLCACHIASQHPRFSGVIHVNTGTGIPQTHDFVYDTAERLGWSLKEYRPKGNDEYEALVLDQGFPGPGHHYKMYQRLKERALRQVLRDHGSRSRKIVFVGGRRRAESTRRMQNVVHKIETGKNISPSSRTVWASPLFNWLPFDKVNYMEAHDLPVNPVVQLLHMSGECLCGSFAQPNELEEIRLWFPDVAAGIDELAEKVAAAGKWAKWGVKPPDSPPVDPNQMSMPMCVTCENRISE